MNRSMQLDTNAARLAGNAASEKYFDQVQPPKEMFTLRPGYFALSSLSWLKFPASGWLNVSATPSTESAAENRVW